MNMIFFSKTLYAIYFYLHYKTIEIKIGEYARGSENEGRLNN